jgi:membrane fusion protein (multidrug efflux system)
MENPAPPPPVVYPSRHSRKRWIVVAAVVVVLVGGISLWHYFSGFESTDDAQVDVHLYPVSARIAGYVQAVHVGDNQYVQEGATLVEIDPEDYQVAVAKARQTSKPRRPPLAPSISMCPLVRWTPAAS